jgi:hypothetical protein
MNFLIISIAIWVLSIIGYIIFNLYSKNKKMESVIVSQKNLIVDFLSLSKGFSELMNKIDDKIWVQSDPEFLSIFEKLKELKTILEQYKDNS